MPLQVKTTDAYGVTYADPSNPDFTVRFKTTSSTKTIQGISVENFVTEIIVNDDLTVTRGSASVTETASVRLRVSGSADASARLKQLVGVITTGSLAWADEHVFTGFRPTTVPAPTA